MKIIFFYGILDMKFYAWSVKLMKIGYMGIEGSFSQEAAIAMERNAELIPLVNAQNVVDALNKGEIDLGVLAESNSTAGEVKETKNALNNIDYSIVKKYDLAIHHCVYIKRNKDLKDIEAIASHEQALNQTIKNRQKLFEGIKIIEVEDTALAAKNLFEGILNENTAIICSKVAGQIFQLKLIYENIEDKKDNITHFIMIRRNANG